MMNCPQCGWKASQEEIDEINNRFNLFAHEYSDQGHTDDGWED